MKRQAFPLFVLFLILLGGCNSQKSGFAPASIDATTPQGAAKLIEILGGALSKGSAASALELAGYPTVGLNRTPLLTLPEWKAGLENSGESLFCLENMTTILMGGQGGSIQVEGNCRFNPAESCNGSFEAATLTFLDFLIDGLRLDGKVQGEIAFSVPQCSEQHSSVTLVSAGPIRVFLKDLDTTVFIHSLSAGVDFSKDPQSDEWIAQLVLLRVGARVGEGDLSLDCSGAMNFQSGESTFLCHRPDEAPAPAPNEGLFICQEPCAAGVCATKGECGPGMDCEGGCCVACVPCETAKDCGASQECTNQCCTDISSVPPDPEPKLSSLKSQVAPPTGPPCSVAEDCEGTGCVCFHGSCECLIPPVGCGDCFLQAGEECETGEQCSECGPNRYIGDANCAQGFSCDKDACTCVPLQGDSNHCLGTDDDCDGRGSCEVKFGLGATYCFAPSCSDLPGVGSGSGVYCSANLPGGGEGLCEALEDGVSLLSPGMELDCISQGAFACCIPFSGDYCPGGASSGSCSSMGGACEERMELGNSFCWTDNVGICPAIPTLTTAGVVCGTAVDPENICEALESTLSSSLELDCVLQASGNSCCISPEVPPLPEADCTDENDNDLDGFIDCADFDCYFDANCQEQGPEECSDGLDNDKDGLVDCADLAYCPFEPNCRELICDDTLDNDGDGPADCKDFDCYFDANCQEQGPEECNDGLDNDADGLFDCDDTEYCSIESNCRELICDDTVDNDDDGATDCLDGDCLFEPICQEQGPDECSDALDNDGDGLFDCEDSEFCSFELKCMELVCDDTLDNDGDGKTDCFDSDCTFDPICVESGVECADLLDNDGDGFTDCNDSDCSFDPLCGKDPPPKE